MNPPERPVFRVVAAIAEVEGVEPDELEYTLHEHVHTGAIRGLVAGGYEQWELTFQVPGHVVSVRADDGVYVDGERVRPLGPGQSGRVE